MSAGPQGQGSPRLLFKDLHGGSTEILPVPFYPEKSHSAYSIHLGGCRKPTTSNKREQGNAGRNDFLRASPLPTGGKSTQSLSKGSGSRFACLKLPFVGIPLRWIPRNVPTLPGVRPGLVRVSVKLVGLYPASVVACVLAGGGIDIKNSEEAPREIYSQRQVVMVVGLGL